MPRILGVIAEYNPFHNGHAWHLSQARASAQADYVVVVMSTCFTQRGDAALLSPKDRAAMALSCGADAVFALPVVHAARDAEHFAHAGVSILDGLGCDVISFGTEISDLPLLHAAADLIESRDEAFTSQVKLRLGNGIPYPAAIAQAADAVLPGAEKLLHQPNSTLAICYLRALQRLSSKMAVCPIQRTSSYHETSVSDSFPSATALRGAILRGDWASAAAAMPSKAYDRLREAAAQGRIHRPESLDAALLYRLRAMGGSEYAVLPDISEGIEHRLQSAAAAASTRSGLLEGAKTRRYPYARLSRLATHALLGLSGDILRQLPPIDSAWLLGFRSDARKLISILSERSRLTLLTRSSDLDTTSAWFRTESLAHDLWALGAGLPSGLAMTQGIAII